MSPRPYGGVTADERRAGRRAALLEAAYDLLGTQGLKATTLRAVCAQAGLSPRYFYESYPDLDALLAEVYDRVATETAEAAARGIAAAGTDADLHTTVRSAALAVLELGHADPRRIRVALVEAPASPVLRARRRAAHRLFVRHVIDYAKLFYDIPPHADARMHFTATLLVAGWSENLVAWLDGDLETTPSALAGMFADAARTLAAPWGRPERRP